MNKTYVSFVLCATLVLGAGMASAATQPDIPGAKDHPLVSRYPGARIVGYSITDFENYKVATGPLKGKSLPNEVVEGKITTLVYELPKDLSSLQVMRNYENALTKGGFGATFSCDNTTCGAYMPRAFVQMQGPSRERHYLRLDAYNMNPQREYRFWTGVLDRKEPKVRVTVMVHKAILNTYVAVDVVEPQAMQTGLVKLDVNALGRTLAEQGRVILDGIHFDTDRATIKPESAETLKVIADYLKANATTRVYVVGHTDDAGEYAHNLELSQRRAAAVVQALTSEHKIPVSRLQAAGVGPVSPTATNSSDVGRARNRRVELVVRR